jgi:DNA-binding transcriptional LysR family regulator
VKLEAIRSFVKLVESGSYAVAAEETFMSPTTLHSHVKSLQSELNTTLVSFDGRRLELTAAGHQFLLFAERTLQEYDALRDRVTGLARPTQTRVRVSAMHGPGVHLVPLLAEAFHEEYPDTVVTVDTGTVGESIAALVSRQVDVAFMYSTHAARHAEVFEVTAVFDDHLAAFVRRDLYRKPDLELFDRLPVAAQPGSTAPPAVFRTLGTGGRPHSAGPL